MSSLRRFVAVSDSVAGQLRPTDLERSGVADAELPGLRELGSPWFPARQVDDRNTRFHSEQVPPWKHTIRCRTRATHVGRFAALPAVTEFIYDSASVSGTSAAIIEIVPRTNELAH